MWGVPRGEEDVLVSPARCQQGWDHLRGQGLKVLHSISCPLAEGGGRGYIHETYCALSDMMGVVQVSYGLYSETPRDFLRRK